MISRYEQRPVFLRLAHRTCRRYAIKSVDRTFVSWVLREAHETVTRVESGEDERRTLHMQIPTGDFIETVRAVCIRGAAFETLPLGLRIRSADCLVRDAAKFV